MWNEATRTKENNNNTLKRIEETQTKLKKKKVEKSQIEFSCHCHCHCTIQHIGDDDAWRTNNICLQMTCHPFIWLHDSNNRRKWLYRKQISRVCVCLPVCLCAAVYSLHSHSHCACSLSCTAVWGDWVLIWNHQPPIFRQKASKHWRRHSIGAKEKIRTGKVGSMRHWYTIK